jgi:hypothetical protein
MGRTTLTAEAGSTGETSEAELSGRWCRNITLSAVENPRPISRHGEWEVGKEVAR